MMADRGLKEETVYDPQLLEAGKCDVLPSEDQSSEELAQAEANLAEAAARRRLCTVPTPNGGEIVFEINIEEKWKTNGGWIYDIRVSKDDKETIHRVVVGKIYPEAVRMNEDDFLEKVMGFLLGPLRVRWMKGLLGYIIVWKQVANSRLPCDEPAVQEGAETHGRLAHGRHVPHQLLLRVPSVPTIGRFPGLVHRRASRQLLAV